MALDVNDDMKTVSDELIYISCNFIVFSGITAQGIIEFMASSLQGIKWGMELFKYKFRYNNLVCRER